MTKGIWIMFILCVVSKPSINSELTGSHICQEEQRYRVNVTKYELKNVTVRRYEWCVQVPPRCSVYTVQRINLTRNEEEDRVRYIDRCCESYYELNGKCSPNSCRFCKHGVCGDDGICQCNRGYWGENCDQECTDENRSCQSECDNCIQGYCDTITGNCTCPPKFIRCDLDCSRSQECVKNCKCDTSTICDPVSQKCAVTEEDYAIGYDDYNDLSAAKFVETNFESPPDRKNDFDVTTSRYLAFVTSTTRESIKNQDTNYLPSKFIEDESMKGTLSFATTEKIEKERDYVIQTEEVQVTSTDRSKASINIYTNRQFRIPDVVSNNKKISHANDGINVNKQKETSAMQSSGESSKKVDIDNRLFIIIISGALFAMLIIVSAAVICMLHKLKAKKKKFVNTFNENEEAKIRDSMSSVSVTTTSIFHTPLPDPPIFENPAFLTQFEGSQSKQSGSFETHVICNMNITSIPMQNQTKPAENLELVYDHPPSTGSYRPASMPEPPNTDCVKATFDPIYDEIPCNQRRVTVTTPPPSYASSEQSTLYMNTK